VKDTKLLAWFSSIFNIRKIVSCTANERHENILKDCQFFLTDQITIIIFRKAVLVSETVSELS